MDDHELNLRYKIYSNYKCAFYPIKCADIGSGIRKRKVKINNLFNIFIMSIKKNKYYKNNILRNKELINKFKSKIIKKNI